MPHATRPTPMRPRALRALVPLLAALLASSLIGASEARPGGDGQQAVATGEVAQHVTVEVLSTRPDLVTGGSAYVEVTVPDDAAAGDLTVDVDGHDVTDAFAVRDDGRYLGVVTGLEVGVNLVTAALPDGRGARLEITNHPIEGPVFSGPHVEPWACDESAEDEYCNRETTYEFLYRSSNPAMTDWQEYDPDDPPNDVDTTTTDEGAEVPFVVRLERGVTVRDNYQVAVLFDPEEPWEPWAPQEAFNEKMVITHGASCDTTYGQGSAPDVLNEDILGAGYLVMSHSLNNAGHNCNVVTQAESMIVTKEHVVETYGELRYTIGSGCSGGALAQLQVANAYPGLYQGITPACSYPDAWSSSMQYVDYYRMLDYFESPDRWEPGVVWEPTQIQQMIGHPNPSNPITFTTAIPFSGRPDRDCPRVPDEEVYHPEDNPDGVRCTFHDYMINVFGVDPETGWARRPADVEGILYGLEGLLAGTVLPQNFVDMNVKIGALDDDARYQRERGTGDEVAIHRAYRSGAANTASNLDEVAIIDFRGPDPGAFHDVYRTYALRERLIREHGHADNQILWRGTVPIFGDPTFTAEAVFAMSRWLDEVEADDREVPRSQKIVENRPDSVVDRCTSGTGIDLPAAYCDVLVESYSTPRQVAGMPATDDVLKCELKPLRRADFHGVDFTGEQWAALEETFPNGVCDYTKPDPNFTTTIPWLTYQTGPPDQDGEVEPVYGGRPMGEPPSSQSFGADDDDRRGSPPDDRGRSDQPGPPDEPGRPDQPGPPGQPGPGGPEGPPDDENAEEPPAAPVPVPDVEGPVEGGMRTGEAQSHYPFLPEDWVEREYFFSGEARDDPFGEGETAPYTSRLMVRAPADPDEFNGTVLVEWHNVTGQSDLQAKWGLSSEAFIREGYAYVGVSAQRAGVCCGANSLQGWDPVRYGDLDHPGDEFSHDIFAQATQAVLEGDPLPFGEGVTDRIEYVIATGASQSADRLRTQINEWQEPTAQFDAYLPQIMPGSEVRDDLVPVLWVNGQDEAGGLLGRLDQDDSDLFRLWEVAGPAHITNRGVQRIVANTVYANLTMGTVNVYDEDTASYYGQQLPDGACVPTNMFPARYAWNASMVALDTWLRTGEPPASVPRVERDEDGGLRFDDDGNVLGGLRLPVLDVPVAAYFAGENPPPQAAPACGPMAYLPLLGSTQKFSSDRLAELYEDDEAYLRQLEAAAEQAVAAGHLLPEDAEDLLRLARADTNPWDGLIPGGLEGGDVFEGPPDHLPMPDALVEMGTPDRLPLPPEVLPRTASAGDGLQQVLGR